MIESLNLRKDIYGEESQQVALIKNNLAILYIDIGNFEKGAEIVLNTLEISEKHNYNSTYIQSLSILGIICKYAGAYENAVKCFHEALNLQKEFAGDESHAYLQLMELLLDVINKVEPDSSFEDLHLQLLELGTSLRTEKNIAYITSIYNIGVYYFQLKKYTEALNCCNEAEELLKERKDKAQYKLFFEIYSLRATIKEKTNDFTEAVTYYSKSLEMAKAEYQQYFAFLSENEREYTLQGKEWFFNEIKYQGHKRKDDSSFIPELVYNTELFHKSLLVNSTKHIQESFFKNDNDSLTKEWNRLRFLKERQIRMETSFAPSERDLSKLKNEIQELEKKLTRNSNPYRNLLQEYSYTWEDVKKQLKPRQAAIEFVFYENQNSEGKHTGDKTYYALLLGHNYQSPKIISCCNSSELQNIINQPITTNILYKLIWESLDNELEGVQEIYISPTGLLHHVAFNALKDNNDNYLIDKYTIHQVMSTRDIRMIKEKKDINKIPPTIALFGGADYDLSNDEMTNVYAEYEVNNSDEETMRSVLDSLDVNRGRGFDHLPGSEEEVQALDSIFSSLKWNVSVYRDKEATELHFKSLSVQSPSIIHISTHGFYFPLIEKSSTSKNIYKKSENPLVRSGLVFTGVNNTWNSPETVIPHPEDGVLTAYEISNMNLSNTQLAVLSACNSGRGDITNNEGTYGLQRAFRLAGVQSMIITLWEIDDMKTKDFMKTFYTKWANEFPLNEAFRQTQKEFREKYGNDIKKWAGFVLVE